MVNVIVQQMENGDAFIEVPPDMLSSLGWKEGDSLNYTVREDGKILVSKVDEPPQTISNDDTELLEVHAVSSFNLVYAVRVPKNLSDDEKDKLVKKTLELNSNVCEVSQSYIGDVINGIKVVDEDVFIQEQIKSTGYLTESVIRESIIDATK